MLLRVSKDVDIKMVSCKLSEILDRMEITDPDACQFAIKVGETAWRYAQMKSPYGLPKTCVTREEKEYYDTLVDERIDSINGVKFMKDFKDGKEMAVKIANNAYMWEDWDIAIGNYDNEEIIDAMSSYFPMEEIKRLYEKEHEKFVQMACECLFEQTYLYGD